MVGSNGNVGSIDLPGLPLPLLGRGLPVPLHPEHKVQVLLGVLLLEEGAEERGAVGGLEQLVEGGVPAAGLQRAGQQGPAAAGQAAVQHLLVHAHHAPGIGRADTGYQRPYRD